MKDISNEPDIVKRAYTDNVTDIGQLTPKEKKQLKTAVKNGVLMVIPAYEYPIKKNRYVMNWNDMIDWFRSQPDYVRD